MELGEKSRENKLDEYENLIDEALDNGILFNFIVEEEQKFDEFGRRGLLKPFKKKDDAKNHFLNKKQKNADPSTVTASFYLQKVLTTPHGSSMLLGFSRKYACYNFTIYENGSANGGCYFWGEKDGKRVANEICSHVFAYLSQLDRTGDKECVHFFCDNCPGQNKNKQMIAMLIHFLGISKVVKNITITYLVPGHTYMPVDSIHAIIEKKIKKMFIQVPSEWPTILPNARKPPYEIIATKYCSILDWKAVTSSKKLRHSR
ncbi:unnamed protein product [Psylliodes chrysocephalus]|uniref:DUF7869 domain-containing protein n=1 Tax=Psylliodes chrysocephalus TaxID=3402493 RepID=A0A9P0GDK1_9CUCU|nr:unnamed protein product [Psylliodes chrysocephala]